MTRGRQPDFSNWREEYRRKTVSAEEAARAVKSGDRVVMANRYYAGPTPVAIFERRDELTDVEILSTAPTFDPGWYLEETNNPFRLVVEKFLNPIARLAHDAGRVDFLPNTTGTWWVPYRDGRPDNRRVDVFITQVSPPDKNGYCSFGHEVWERKKYCQIARTVIGEVNEDAIRTYGDNFIHVSEIDCFVPVPPVRVTPEDIERVIAAFPEKRQEEIRRVSPGFVPLAVKQVVSRINEVDLAAVERALDVDPPNEAVRGVAANLRTVVRDRDTIQISVGRPSKWMVELGVFDDCSDLAIYSELACPGLVRLVERGIVTGRYATLHPGKAVLTGLGGCRWDEIQFAHNNPTFELYGAEYVMYLPNVIANDNMVSINNGLQVDLTGQITCETQFGARLINGPGGQPDLHIGAFYSKGGRAVTLLRSTAFQGGVSAIVSQLDAGSQVDIPRCYADMVVTEYGVASLSSKTHSERADALIGIAHPDFRASLREAAKKRQSF